MSRIIGLIAVLIVLLVGALMAKRQMGGMHSAPMPASLASGAAAPDAPVPQEARRITDQVQRDVDRMVEDHDRQLKQNLDSQTP